MRAGAGRIQVVPAARMTRPPCLLSQCRARDAAFVLRWLCLTGRLAATVHGNTPARKDATCTSWRTRWRGSRPG
jgi:hypothetical protein